MRIKRLDLIAFGPFTKVNLAFNSEDPGLHIIFGPNEIGKSSSLRALKALLFGFPERTPDNFKHTNDQLLVGGCLTRRDGKEIELLRRKKRKMDLLDPDGNPIDSSTFSDFLHGIDAEIFESLYGLDHDILVQGGKDILAQKGEVGQALFAAGAGISSFRKILDHLDTEADQLFSARSTSRQINKAITEYKALRKSVKEESLSSRNWKDHRKSLLEAEKERGLLQKQRIEKEAEKRHLERLKRAIPLLTSRDDFQERLQALGEVTILPENFSQGQQSVSQGLRDKKLHIEKAKHRLSVLQEEKKAISFNPLLLERAETIEEIHQGLSEYRKGMKDRVKLDGMRISSNKESRDLLKKVDPKLPLEKIETLQPVLNRRKTIQKLSAQYETLVFQVSLTKKEYQNISRDLKEIEKRISLSPLRQDAGDLMQAIKLARNVGDIDEQILSKARELDMDKKTGLAEIKRLELWNGDFQNLTALPLPLLETIKHFENRFKALEDDKAQLQKDHVAFTKELNQAKSEIKKIEYAGEVPTETELQESRSKREQGWHLIKRKWLDGEEIDAESKAYDPSLGLPEAFEKQMTQADHLSDRLRREAGRVANFAELRARSEVLEHALSENDQKDIKHEKNLKSLQMEWIEIWKKSDIAPHSPKEMLSWVNEFKTLRSKGYEILKKEREIEEKIEDRRQRRQQLSDALKNLKEEKSFSHETLTPLLIFSESVSEKMIQNQAKLEKLEEKRDELRKGLDTAEVDQTSAEAEMQSWNHHWREALEGLGIRNKIPPSEASELLDDLQACFNKLKEADDFRKRIDGIQRDATTYEKDVNAILNQAAPDLLKQALEQAVANLNILQKKASQDKALLEKTHAEIKKTEDEIGEAKTELDSLEEQSQNFFSIAGCKTDSELNEAIRKSAELQKLKEKLTEVETTLVQLSEGISLEDLVRQAEGVDPDEVPGKITFTGQKIEELNQEIDRLSEEIGDENKTLKQMDGSAKAAEAAEATERLSAKILRLTDQFVRTKLASKILHHEIDRYRSEHQDPVLSIASKHFSELTLGSFSKIRTDLNDKGNPILVGERPDKIRVTVEGMSTGSRDQLYFSLRLGTLEWRLQSSEPMPLILDDILINFDDERSRATLKALANLAEKTQVILFTHHRQILEDAKKIEGKGSIHVHEL